MAPGQEETQRSSGPTTATLLQTSREGKKLTSGDKATGAELRLESGPSPPGPGEISKSTAIHPSVRGPEEDPIPLAPNTFLLLLTAKDSSFLGGEHRCGHLHGGSG